MRAFFRQRKEIRADAIAKALRALENLPTARAFREGDASLVWDLAEILEVVTAARRWTRPCSLAGLLVRDADLWISSWLAEFESPLASGPHLAALGRTLTTHLRRVAERLATVVELEGREVASEAKRSAVDQDDPAPRCPYRTL